MSNLLAQLFELLYYLAGPFLLVLLAFLFCTLLHELGHAVPVLFMTQGRVEIHIGSQGDPKGSLRCHLGRLDMFFRYNPFSWNRGICKPPQEALSAYKRIIYFATGPLTSLTLALLSWYLLRKFDVEGLLRFILGMVFFASTVQTISTSIPMTYRGKTPDGRIRMSDAAVILQLIQNKYLPYEYAQAAEHIRQNKFSEAATLMENTLTAGYKNVEIYRLASYAHLQLQNDDRAIEIFEAFKTRYTLNENDYINEGIAWFRLCQPQKALQNAQKALELDHNNIYALNLRGYIFCTMNLDTDALADLEKAISLSPELADAICNRGWVKIKLGKLEEGLTDVNHSLTLAPSNAYAYRNLGLYHLKKNEPGKAIDLLQKAKRIDPTTHLADEYLAEAQSMNTQLPAV